jgi:hypothetical protein
MISVSKNSILNRPLLFALLSFFILLNSFGSRTLSRSDCLLFGRCYHSWVEDILIISLFCFGIIICYVVTIDQHKKHFFSVFIGVASLLITSIGAAVLFIYHILYKGNTGVFVWDAMEKVIPYHVQLGVLFFENFMILNFILLFLKPLKLWIKISGLFLALAGFLIFEI